MLRVACNLLLWLLGCVALLQDGGTGQQAQDSSEWGREQQCNICCVHKVKG
jgi:hypothetical protein